MQVYITLYMGLLNYTTKIDADKTASEIAKCLSMHGAKSIMTDYQEGILVGISFAIDLNGRTLGFKLPCDWKPVYEVMAKGKRFSYGIRGEKMKSELRLQSVRTAWRIVKVWIDAQMALIETQMVSTAQVFLPYMQMGNDQTLADRVLNDPKFLLGNGQ